MNLDLLKVQNKTRLPLTWVSILRSSQKRVAKVAPLITKDLARALALVPK
jgi:hypothetical protein